MEGGSEVDTDFEERDSIEGGSEEEEAVEEARKEDEQEEFEQYRCRFEFMNSFGWVIKDLLT